MRVAIAGILYVIALLWGLWAVTLSGFTIFAYLGGPAAWDAHLAYCVSLVGLIPIIGGLVASFMAGAIQGWGFFHAAFNLMGYFIPLGIAGLLVRQRQPAND